MGRHSFAAVRRHTHCIGKAVENIVDNRIRHHMYTDDLVDSMAGRVDAVLEAEVEVAHWEGRHMVDSDTYPEGERRAEEVVEYSYHRWVLYPDPIDHSHDRLTL